MNALKYEVNEKNRRKLMEMKMAGKQIGGGIPIYLSRTWIIKS